ncbi:MAG: hypothetical protein P1U86_20720 [Verrucomicrobiales bacterium]|nr:hypothetical protein [Verrucomicrobiales bacterium]
MSTFSQWLILLRVHIRMMRVKALIAAKRSRLMTGTIVTFLISYMIAAYWLFSEGLEYVSNLPAAGSLLSDRLIFVMFFCFMMMLIFSVGVTSYISLYRNRDTRWLLTLPVSHQAIFLWKVFESAMVSSWGLIFILTPLLAAFAKIREVSPDFFIKTAFVLVLFLILVSSIGAALLIIATRWFSARKLLLGLALVALISFGSALKQGIEDEKAAKDSGLSAALTFQRVLHHTNASVNRGMPSAWLSSSVIDWTRPYRHFGSAMYPTLLLSNALMGILLLTWAGNRWFYQSWNRSLQSAAFSAQRKYLRNRSSTAQILRDFPRTPFLARFIGRPIAAISGKDLKTFFRDPAQWVQFTVVFGLLAIYSSGLRKMNGDMEQVRDLYLVAFLNLAVCALALSTLTTRFVFPQFSLEGRRLWILAMSPLKMQSIILQKFISSTLASGALVMVILVISGYNLQLGVRDSLFFIAAVALLAIGLNGLAVGLGVLFPNLEESNAAKIVSGFGGTLCLVGSFIYILAFILVLAFLRWDVFKDGVVDPFWYESPKSQAGIAIILGLTILVTVLPLFFSRKKLKRLEILSII